MKVELITHTPDPEKLIAATAKLCYSSSGINELMDDLTEDKIASFVKMLADIGHESPFEHATFTFGIEGVSRSFLAQITRHRIASFMVQSQRYVVKDNFNYITPPEIAAIPEALEVFEQSMARELEDYNRLTDILYKKHYETMLSEGKSEKKSARDAQKKAIEDARFVLPNACDTKMVVTMNTRSLYNFFELRCCERAQWEIREAACEMLRILSEKFPLIFASAGPACSRGACSEGAMTCGKPWKRK